VHPEAVSFPGGERTAYTAAAVILAADALTGASPGAHLFGAP
jgi:MMP endo-(1,4)-3-O-methyl-alpha-D-mannosidase